MTMLSPINLITPSGDELQAREPFIEEPGHRRSGCSCTSRKSGKEISDTRTRRRRRIVCAALMLVMACLVTVMLTVVAPKLAQNELDGTHIEMLSMNITHPSDSLVYKGMRDSLKSSNPFFLADAKLKIDHVGPFSGTMNPMSVSILFAGKKLGSFHMPAISIQAGQENYVSIEQQEFEVTDMDVWDEFGVKLLENETVTWQLQANDGMVRCSFGKWGGLKFEKQITLAGMRGLSDVRLRVFDLTQSTPSQVRMHMQVCIFNPASLRIMPLGQLYFGVFYGGARMGTISALNTSFPIIATQPSHKECAQFGKYGYNSQLFEGVMAPETGADQITGELMSNYLANRVTQVEVVADRPLADSIPLYNPLMEHLQLETNLSGISTAIISAAGFKGVSVVPVDNTSVRMRLNASVTIQNPLGNHSPITVQALQLQGGLSGPGANGATQLLGLLKTSNVTLTPSAGRVGGEGDLALTGLEATLDLTGQGQAFGDFVTNLVQADELALSLDGKGAVQLQADALGDREIPLSGVPVALPDPSKDVPPITLQGMKGLSDFSVVSYEFPANMPLGPNGEIGTGVKLLITAQIGNPSVFSVPLGNISATVHAPVTPHGASAGLTDAAATMDTATTARRLSLGNSMADDSMAVLGLVRATELTMYPGSNLVQMEGFVHPTDDAGRMATEQVLGTYLAGKSAQLLVRGLDEPGRGSDVAWVRQAVASLSVPTKFPSPGADYNLLSNFTIESLTMKFASSSSSSAAALVSIAANVSAIAHIPTQVGFPLDIPATGMEVIMSDGQTAVASFSLRGDTPVAYYPPNAEGEAHIVVSFNETPLVVSDEQSAAFSAFMSKAMKASSFDVGMAGTCAPTIQSNIMPGGPLHLPPIPFHGSAPQTGMGSLLGDVKISQVDTQSGSPGKLVMSASVAVRNPSNLLIDLGPVNFDVMVGDWSLARASVTSFKLLPYPEVTSFQGVPIVYTTPTDPAGAAVGKEFFSNFISGIDQQISLRGPPDGSGTSNPLLKPAITAFESTLPLTGSKYKMITAVQMKIDSLVWLLQCVGLVPGTGVSGTGYSSDFCKVNAVLHVYNPFSSEINVKSCRVDNYPCLKTDPKDSSHCLEYHTQSMGLYTPDDINIRIPAKSHASVTEHQVYLYSNIWNMYMLETLWACLTPQCLVRVNGTIIIELGPAEAPFIQEFNFASGDIPTSLL